MIVFLNPKVIAHRNPPDAFRWLINALGNVQIVELEPDDREAQIEHQIEAFRPDRWLVIDDDPTAYSEVVQARVFVASADRGLTRGARAFALAREIAERYGSPARTTFDSKIILFCDLDGVTHPVNGRVFSCRTLLWNLLRAAPQLRVVLTTSWREHQPFPSLVSRVLEGGGEDLAPRFLGVTPVLRERHKWPRHEEIGLWLAENDFPRWLALDDDPRLFAPDLSELIVCDPRTGLTPKTVQRVLQRLHPVLFLDFDGVLHPEGAEVDALFCHAPLIWSLLRETPNLQVVFSTSWREKHSLAALVDFATAGGGEDLANRFIDTTPVIRPQAHEGDYRQRENECRAWVRQTGHLGPWLALDDMPYWFEFGTPHAVITDCEAGLTPADVIQVIDRFEEFSRCA